MNKVGSAAKVKLNSFDDLFGTEQPQAGIEQVTMLPMKRRLDWLWIELLKNGL